MSTRARYALRRTADGDAILDSAGAAASADVDELAKALERTRAQGLAAVSEQRRIVHQLRAAGASWAVIGKCLGVSREAAHKRYAGDTAGSAARDANGAVNTAKVDELARVLARARAQEFAAANRQRLTVQQLRATGASWTVIGKCLGVSREAAHKRYAGDALL